MRPENDRQSLISEILALLVTYGAWYNNKRHWCFMAVQDGGCTTVSTAVDWILQNEPRLMQAGEADPAPGEDDAAPGLVRVASSNTTNTRWTKMVNKKLFEACGESGDKDLAQIREAIEWGADIDQRNGEGGVQGRSPLHQAARNNQPKAVKLLLKLGADPNNDSAGGWAPLHNVANFHGSGLGKDGNKVHHVEQNHYDPDKKTYTGGASYKDVMCALLEANANVNFAIDGKAWRGKTPMMIAKDQQKTDLLDLMSLYSTQ